MTWKETCPMDERLKFISYYLEGELTISSLCRAFGISRKTGYKFINRYLECGLDGLKDLSRSPHNHPHAVSESVIQTVLEARKRHPTWGPRKLRAWLQNHCSETIFPASSTIGEILTRHGLTVPRRRSRKTPLYNKPFRGCDYPNAVWSADFKGCFLTGDNIRCDPLTISDNYSRYLIRCQAVPATGYFDVRPVFESAFREYGLPWAMRTDNGSPFATTTVGGLSKLSIWWMKLGIIPERIRPGHPEQNGRHERMHRTLKQDTASPPKKNWRLQQRAFDRFLTEYNRERPHEALGLNTPDSRYESASRPYPMILPEITYPDSMIVRSVKFQGDISWKAKHIYLSKTLAGELVGLHQIDDRFWDIYFANIKLAQLDTFELKLKHLPNNYKQND